MAKNEKKKPLTSKSASQGVTTQPSTATPQRKSAIDYAPARAHLLQADPVIASLVKANPDYEPRAWTKTLPKMDAFGTIIFQIAGQQISVAATRSIIKKLTDSFGGKLPTHTQLLAAETEVIRNAGFSARKAETIRAVAEQFQNGNLSMAKLKKLPDDKVEALLTSITGIGPWTAQGFLIIALHREDVVLPGDLALRKSIQRAYKLKQMPSQDEVVAIAEAWRPYRTLATSYLFSAAFT